jgi:hypothetical protein
MSKTYNVNIEGAFVETIGGSTKTSIHQHICFAFGKPTVIQGKQ